MVVLSKGQRKAGSLRLEGDVSDVAGLAQRILDEAEQRIANNIGRVTPSQ